MGRFAAGTVVTVHPFTQHPDGDEVTIGNATQSTFLSLPADAVDLLSSLSEGHTVGETQARYAQKYGETPDMEDFLDYLESEGFVTLQVDDPAADTAHIQAQPAPAPRRYHFDGIPQSVAQRLCSRPVVLGCALLIALGLLLVGLDPALVPPPSIMVFKHNLTLMSLETSAFILATIFVHEMAHLIAARAAGVPSRMGIGTRLWVLVAETDMTGVWTAPRRQRYLAFVAGPLVDAVAASILVVVLFAGRHGWIDLAPWALLLCRVWLFTYFIRLIWQCFLFVRTDFYYVLATAFNCKSLMADTETYLHNRLARFIPSLQTVDQSRIPVRERRVIQWYALIWLSGRACAFGALVFITLPILWGYVLEIGGILFGGHSTRYAVVDVLLWSTLAAVVQGSGLVLWIRSVVQARRS